MLESWISFGVALLVQLAFFLGHAVYEKKLATVPRTLLHGLILGLLIGLAYDLLLGLQLGLFSYTLGFTVPFLPLNAALSYGIFVASTLLLQRVQTGHFLAWLILLVTTYEVTNLYFPVWAYEFSLPTIPTLALLLVGYSSGALLASLVAKRWFGYEFILKLDRAKP